MWGPRALAKPSIDQGRDLSERRAAVAAGGLVDACETSSCALSGTGRQAVNGGDLFRGIRGDKGNGALRRRLRCPKDPCEWAKYFRDMAGA